MSFNKRFINYKNLKSTSERGLEELIDYIRKPDSLIIENDGLCEQVCDIVNFSKSKEEIVEKLKNIGFYEFT